MGDHIAHDPFAIGPVSAVALGGELHGPPSVRLQLDELVGRRLPDLKRHADQELKNDFGIHRIGLATHHGGFTEFLDRFRVGDHHLDVLAPVQRQRKLLAVATGRFQAHAYLFAVLGRPFDELAMPRDHVLKAGDRESLLLR